MAAGTLSLSILSSKNEGLTMSPSDLINNYMFGIPLCTTDGRELSTETIKQKLTAAQKQIEGFLQLKLRKQMYVEDRDWIRNEFARWGYIKTSYPVHKSYELYGYINEVKQVTYPMEWISNKKNNSDDVPFRVIYLIPNTGGSGATMQSNAFVYSGITPHLGFLGQDFIPNYWKCRYCTGYDVIPADIESAVAKLAAIQVLAILGDILLGIGVSSQSLSLDGLSQSTSNIKSSQGGIFAGRIKQYGEELKQELANLKGIYRGMIFEVL